MAHSRLKAKGRRECGPYVIVPKDILLSDEYALLPAPAVKLMFDVYARYNGSNNGDFAASWTFMKSRGWRSKGTLQRALQALLTAGWLILTRQGGRHKASLYAVSFRPIDECKGKLDVLPTVVAPDSWRTNEIKNGAPHTGYFDPATGAINEKLKVARH